MTDPIDLDSIIPHHSTLKWLHEELEVSHALADDSDEFDQKRLIHLERLRDLVAGLPLHNLRCNEVIRSFQKKYEDAMALNRIYSDGLHNANGITFYFDPNNGNSLVVAPKAIEYTSKMGEAGDAYLSSVAFQGKYNLPVKFRWHGLWETMQQAARETPRGEDSEA